MGQRPLTACAGAGMRMPRIPVSLVDLGGSRLRGGDQFSAPARLYGAGCGLSVRAAEAAGPLRMRLLLLLLRRRRRCPDDASANWGGGVLQEIKDAVRHGPCSSSRFGK